MKKETISFYKEKGLPRGSHHIVKVKPLKSDNEDRLYSVLYVSQDDLQVQIGVTNLVVGPKTVMHFKDKKEFKKSDKKEFNKFYKEALQLIK